MEENLKHLELIANASSEYKKSIDEITKGFNFKPFVKIKISIEFETEDNRQIEIVSDGNITGYVKY